MDMLSNHCSHVTKHISEIHLCIECHSVAAFENLSLKPASTLVDTLSRLNMPPQASNMLIFCPGPKTCQNNGGQECTFAPAVGCFEFVDDRLVPDLSLCIFN